MQLQNVQNKTKHVSFPLYPFARHKKKNNKPHKDIHMYKFEMQTENKIKNDIHIHTHTYIYIYEKVI